MSEEADELRKTLYDVRSQRDNLKNEIDKLRRELEAYRSSVRIDVLMEGPRFQGCNISQLRRAYEITRENS